MSATQSSTIFASTSVKQLFLSRAFCTLVAKAMSTPEFKSLRANNLRVAQEDQLGHMANGMYTLFNKLTPVFSDQEPHDVLLRECHQRTTAARNAMATSLDKFVSAAHTVVNESGERSDSDKSEYQARVAALAAEKKLARQRAHEDLLEKQRLAKEDRIAKANALHAAKVKELALVEATTLSRRKLTAKKNPAWGADAVKDIQTLSTKATKELEKEKLAAKLRSLEREILLRKGALRTSDSEAKKYGLPAPDKQVRTELCKKEESCASITRDFRSGQTIARGATAVVLANLTGLVKAQQADQANSTRESWAMWTAKKAGKASANSAYFAATHPAATGVAVGTAAAAYHLGTVDRKSSKTLDFLRSLSYSVRTGVWRASNEVLSLGVKHALTVGATATVNTVVAAADGTTKVVEKAVDYSTMTAAQLKEVQRITSKLINSAV